MTDGPALLPLRARDAGFYIVYVYATHGYLISKYLNPRMNTRSDEYGGSLENRVRLVRELIEDTKEAVGDRCTVAVRFSADEAICGDGDPILGERCEMFEMLANLPDLWDINIADYSLEMSVSRFVREGSESSVLIVRAGAAGLEAARALCARGYQVMLAEATREIGGRVTREAALPRMNEYIRVRDYREQQLAEMTNVEIFRESRMTVEDVLAVEAGHVAIATCAKWRPERFDEQVYRPIADGDVAARVLTPDDIMDGTLSEGPTLVYDDDGYYMAGVIAERLQAVGSDATYVTPSNSVSQWAGNTSERWRIRSDLLKLGIGIQTAQTLLRFDGSEAVLACAYCDVESRIAVQNIVMVTARKPNDALFQAIRVRQGDRPFSLARIGDCEAPAIIAAAVYAGHCYAQELDMDVDIDLPVRHDRVDVGLDELAGKASWKSPGEQWALTAHISTRSCYTMRKRSRERPILPNWRGPSRKAITAKSWVFWSRWNGTPMGPLRP